MRTINKHHIEPLHKYNILLPKNWALVNIVYKELTDQYILELAYDPEEEIECNLTLVLASNWDLTDKLFNTIEGILGISIKPDNSLVLISETNDIN